MAPLERPAPGGSAWAVAAPARRRPWLAAAVAGSLGLLCLRPGAARGAPAQREQAARACEPPGQPPQAGAGGLDEELLLLVQTSASVSVSAPQEPGNVSASEPVTGASAPVPQNLAGAPAPRPPGDPASASVPVPRGPAAPPQPAGAPAPAREPAGVQDNTSASEEVPLARAGATAPEQPAASAAVPAPTDNASASEADPIVRAGSTEPEQPAASTTVPAPTDPAPAGEELPTRRYLRAVRQELPDGSAAALRAELAADEQVFEEADVLVDANARAARGAAGSAVEDGVGGGAAGSALRLLPSLRRMQSEVEAAGIPAPLGLLAACVMAAAAASAATLVCGWGRRADEGAALRRRVEKVRMVSGDVVEKLFGLGADAPLFGGDAEAGLAGRGMLLRVRGRVVPGPDRTHLVAPISGRPCVMYSASVSPQSQDGVHPQPIARHSKGTDFAIELADAPHLRVRVHHQDAKLFCMVDGHLSCEQSFSEASDSRVDFILSHHSAQGMPGDILTQAGTGLDGGLDGTLEFRESALLIGSSVSAVGELCREKDGSLQMYPWRPPPSSRAIFGKKAAAAAPARDLLAGRVLASDDPSLLDPAPSVMQRMFG